MSYEPIVATVGTAVDLCRSRAPPVLSLRPRDIARSQGARPCVPVRLHHLTDDLLQRAVGRDYDLLPRTIFIGRIEERCLGAVRALACWDK